MADKSGRLTIVQYAGDFLEAAERLAAGGGETYRAQRYSVEFVEGLARDNEAVTTITGFTDTAYDVVLPSGARAIGAGFTDRFDGAAMVRLVEETRPDRLILRTPSRPVMRWAIRNRCRTLLTLADSFGDRSWKSRVAHGLLRRLLVNDVFEVVANHGRRAAENLVAMGVAPSRVIAWDYPALDTPADRPAKVAPGTPLSVLFVGMLIPDKGVDDLVEAIARLRGKQVPVRLDLIGSGDGERVRALIAARGLEGGATVVGTVPNDQVVARMAAADVVVVPSRHSYPEGLPLTIYEAYCARTPLVVSDHPMFAGNVVDGEGGLVFPAGDAEALAACLARLAREPDLYARLSASGQAAWERLQIPVLWGELIERWLADDHAWLARHSMAAA